jgi:PGF-pre-PGF domain-containing protein
VNFDYLPLYHYIAAPVTNPTTPPSGTPTGSSGGGTTVAGGTTTTTGGLFAGTTSSAVFTNITAGVPVTVYTNSSDVPLTSLTLTTNTNLTNVSVNTSSVDTFLFTDMKIDTSAAWWSGTTYKSFQINYANINDAQITDVVMNFTVNTSWMTANNINPSSIALYRNVGGGAIGTWTALPTTLVSNNSQYYYFSAVSPGFSDYTIYGEYPNPDYQKMTIFDKIGGFFRNFVPTFFRQTSWGYVFYYLIVILVLGGIVFVSYNLFNRFRSKNAQKAWKEANKRKKKK